MTRTMQQTALVTGGSQGFGRALARTLDAAGWRVVVDARSVTDLAALQAELPRVIVVPGDVTDAAHRATLADAAGGSLELLVNNASDLGPSPLPSLADYPIAALHRVYDTNVIAPLALIQLLLPALRAGGGVVVNVSSDAAVEAYEGWGGYGSAKAALDHLSAVLGQENPEVGVYAFDPGDMRTAMHQAAFPGEDIDDRPDPASVVPALLRLLDERPPSRRVRAADLAVSA